jgi:flagellar biosynthetic protein FliP
MAARAALLLGLWLIPQAVGAEPAGGDATALTLSVQGGGQMSAALKILLMLTALAFAPAILMCLTSFTRIIVVLGFSRQALGLGQTPPTQVLIGIALFLTLFTMAPTLGRIQRQAVDPYWAGQLDEGQAFGAGFSVLKDFMLRHTREDDLALFYGIAQEERPQNALDVPARILAPAFMLSELKTAFQMGFLLFLPFLLIDLIVSSVLMAMGMMMLPPVIVSLPFKILLFVLADGWNLLVGSLARSFA